MASHGPGNWPVPRLCCRKLLPVVGSYFVSFTLITASFDQGLSIVEVAHDSPATSQKSQLYDTWHGIPYFLLLFIDMTLFLRDKECEQVTEQNLQGVTEVHGSDLVSTACGQT